MSLSRANRAMRGTGSFGAVPSALALLLAGGCADPHTPDRRDADLVAVTIGDAPVIERHLAHDDIASGAVSMAEVLRHGELLFTASFNDLDGAGRPRTTGTGEPRSRRSAPQNFNRVSGPDANSCAGCHNRPAPGGGGDNVANVFVLGQRLPFVNFDGGPGDGSEPQTLTTVGNERNTVGLFGAGFIELLAREMTAELHRIRAEAIRRSEASGEPVRRELITKGVSFGALTCLPDGSVDTSEVVGVDPDLVIRPFHQKGAVVSLREFSNNAFNHHHGMQSAERFGRGRDPDGDGEVDELTMGDLTAVTLFQATLPAPSRVSAADPTAAAAAARGEQLFATLGCTSCHVPALRLDDPVFSEPNPFNPPGNLRPDDDAQPIAVDLTAVGPAPRLARDDSGGVWVPAFTDLKRHDLGPELDNEELEQDGIPTSHWLTRKLWGIASEAPFLHHGRATLLSEAIEAHGGEATAARAAYRRLAAADQAAVIEFLETLRIVTGDGRSDAPSGRIGEAPAIRRHLAQVDIDAGRIPFDQLLAHGEALFATEFNALDGQGRPETTGTGEPRPRRSAPENFNRISAPDSNSCAGCHNRPRRGGGGDNVTNVFVLGQRLPFVNFDGGPGDGFARHTLADVGNERNAPGMFGAGYIELLAREMTADLQRIRDEATRLAKDYGEPVRRELITKGVAFGSITCLPSGGVDTTAIEGVDHDLVVRPFHQKGAVTSLREFTNNALNHHHGMQSAERFGTGTDPDQDGRIDELTAGDVTAVTLFQATLPVPGRVRPTDPLTRVAVARGEERFAAIGCASCHVPALRLEDPVFTEPNPYNPPGNLHPSDVVEPYAVDLTTRGPSPRLSRAEDGSVLVPAFTDLKRHDMGPQLDTERLEQDGIPTRMWLTRKLWGMANEPPFLHHGRALLFGDAILAHGGEAQGARDAYASLPAHQQDEIIAFLKTLQVLPPGTATTELER